MKLLIGAIAEGLEFDGGTIYEKSLGGSETAFAMMMRELAKRGHEVHAYTHCPRPGVYDDVTYHHIKDFSAVACIYEFDVLFVYRHYNWLTFPSHARLRILVNHDVLVPDGKAQFMASLWQTDILFNLSEYHKRQYCEHLPELDSHIWVTKNGIDLEEIDKSIVDIKKNKKQFVYGSRPERGLDVLLRDVWPRIYEKDPERVLCIAGYSLDAGVKLPDHMITFYEGIKNIIEETPGVVDMGCLKKSDWYRLLCNSAAYLYVTEFKEIFCIAAAESQACGTPVVATQDFALSEVIADQRCLVPGKHTSKEYQDDFVNRVEELSKNDIYYKSVQRIGREHVENQYPWPKVASEWEEKILSFFEERYQKNKHWIFKQLLYNSDVLLAREMAIQEGMEAEQREAECILVCAKEYKDEYAHDDPEVLTSVCDDFTQLGRVPVIAPHFKGAKTLLEIGCHYAEHSIGLSNLYPDLKVIATDFSPACIAQANKFKDTIAKYPENIELKIRGWEAALASGEDKVDIVFAGEILEHIDEPYAFIDQIERYVIPGGLLILTVPSGPWEAQSLHHKDRFSESEPRYHISDFRFRDLQEVFGKKKDFSLSYCPNGITERGELVGNWVLVYRAAASPTGRIDPRRKFLTTRPFKGVSTCIIVANEEENIKRCLNSVKEVSDELIVIGTPNCQDKTLEIAQECGARVFRTTGDAPATPQELIDKLGPGDFSWWRNESIKDAKYSWILWIDADEILTGSAGMPKYLNSEIFNGYVVKQHHLCIDMPKVVPDIPIRLLKNFKGYRAYGIIHEHLSKSLNEPISPAFHLDDVNIAHFGYITEQHRRQKCYGRNLNLLMKDRIINPERTLGLILLQRDYHNLISLNLERTQGVLDEKMELWLQTICSIHRENFQNKENDIHYKLSFALYQQALALMGQAGMPVNGCESPPFEVGLWLGGGIGGLQESGGRENAHRLWFANTQDCADYLNRQRDTLVRLLLPA